MNSNYIGELGVKMEGKAESIQVRENNMCIGLGTRKSSNKIQTMKEKSKD